jgi:hypothetical protein
MRRTQLITTVALAAAFVAPATSAARPWEDAHPQAAPASASNSYQDLRSPDARDAARPSETRQYSDLRSPDARDAAAASTQSAYQDLRSPDARDVGRPPVEIPTPVVEIREVPGSGFDWGDAGIGAVGMLAMFSIAAGLALTVGGRRRRRGLQVPAH